MPCRATLANGRLRAQNTGAKTAMVTAIVAIRAETNRIPDLADKIADMQGVSEVFSVAGRVDLGLD